MSKIALFGGAFDPPHNGHQQVAQSLLELEYVDQVWYVPVFRHPWAEKIGKVFLTDYLLRVEMLKMILTQGTKIAHYRDVSFTYPTLEYFHKKFPEHQFFWVMGSEYLPKFDLFLKDHPKLMDYPIFVYPRYGFPVKNLYQNMIPLNGVDQINISSSMIRDKVKSGQQFFELVNEKVSNLIGKENLYK